MAAKEAIGVGRKGRAWLCKFTFKYLEVEVLVGHSGRTVQKIPDHRSMKLERKL